MAGVLKTKAQIRKAAKELFAERDPVLDWFLVDDIARSLEVARTFEDRIDVDQIKRALAAAARFLFAEKVVLSTPARTRNQAIVLAAAFAVLGDLLLNDTSRRKLACWYWSGVFAPRGPTDRSLEASVEEIKAWVNGESPPDLVRSLELAPNVLRSATTSGNPATFGAIAMIMKRNPRDWISGEPLEVVLRSAKPPTKGTPYGQRRDKIEIHHIYPRAFVRQQGGHPLVDSVINKTPIWGQTNGAMLGNAPPGYLEKIERRGVTRERLDALLDSHCIDVELLRLTPPQFDEFLATREARLMRLIEAAVSAQGL